jgi:hypothetical protein
MIAFHATLETFTFAGANNINLLTNGEQTDSDLLPFFDLWFFGTELAYKTQGGQIIDLQMPQLATC